MSARDLFIAFGGSVVIAFAYAIGHLRGLSRGWDRGYREGRADQEQLDRAWPLPTSPGAGEDRGLT